MARRRTNYAIETMMDRIAAHLGMDRLELRRRNLIRADEFPYTIPSGSTYDSGDYHTVIDKVLAHADYAALTAERDRLRAEGLCAGIGIAACLEPSGGNSSFEPLLNENNRTSTWMEGSRVIIDALGGVTVTIHTTSSGQGHETLAATVVGEELGIDPDRIRVTRPDSLSSLPGNSPVGSRMAIMLGGAAARAARDLKRQLVAIGAHAMGIDPSEASYEAGTITAPDGRRRGLGRVGGYRPQAVPRPCRRAPTPVSPPPSSSRCRPASPFPRTARCRCIPAIPSSSTSS